MACLFVNHRLCRPPSGHVYFCACTYKPLHSVDVRPRFYTALYPSQYGETKTHVCVNADFLNQTRGGFLTFALAPRCAGWINFSISLTHTRHSIYLSRKWKHVYNSDRPYYTKDGLFLHAKAPKQSISSNRISWFLVFNQLVGLTTLSEFDLRSA